MADVLVRKTIGGVTYEFRVIVSAGGTMKSVGVYKGSSKVLYRIEGIGSSAAETGPGAMEEKVVRPLVDHLRGPVHDLENFPAKMPRTLTLTSGARLQKIG